MEVEIDSREAGIALITGQIVEAWLGRQPIKSGAVTPAQLADVILSVRIGLASPIVGLPEQGAEPKPGLRLVDKP